MVRKMSLLLLIASFFLRANSINLDELDLSEATIQIPEDRVRSKDYAKLLYNKHGFFVSKNKKIKRVHEYDMDTAFHDKNVNDIMKYALNGEFQISELDNGEYKVYAKGNLNGGGPGGATVGFYAGKFLTHFVGHGTIQIVAVCSGPAYLVTLASLEATFGPAIEATSNVVGLGTGVIGGVATGPA